MDWKKLSSIEVIVFTLVFLLIGNVNAEELTVAEIIGFEVLVAGSCDHGFQCAFGHSFLRAIKRNGTSVADPVFSFTTDNYQPKSLTDKIGYSAKGLFGLPLEYNVTTVKAIIREYSIGEKRKIQRIPLEMTNRNKEELIKNINILFFAKKLSQFPEPKKGYDILFNNCAGKIVELLNKSGLPRETFGIAIPSNLSEHLYRTYNSHYPVIEIPYNSNLNSTKMELQFAALPEEYYKFCEDTECAKIIVQTFIKYFPEGKIVYPVYTRPDPITPESFETRNQPTDWKGLKPVVEKHYDLIKRNSQQNQNGVQ